MNQSVSCFNHGQVLVIMRDSPCCRDPGTEDDSDSVLINSLSHKVLAGNLLYRLKQCSVMCMNSGSATLPVGYEASSSGEAMVTVLKSSLVCVSVRNTELCRRNSICAFFWFPLPSFSIEGTLLHFRLYSLCLPIVRGCTVPVDSGSHSWSSFKGDTNTDGQIVYW